MKNGTLILPELRWDYGKAELGTAEEISSQKAVGRRAGIEENTYALMRRCI
jgi:hypothetical protein